MLLPGSAFSATDYQLLCGLQVAHAYLQAESTPAGRLDDNTTVSQVVPSNSLRQHCQHVVQGIRVDMSYSLRLAPQVCVKHLITSSASLQHVDPSDLVILPLSGGCPG